ncbi:MAG: hypothetical protein ACW990_04395 [Promethearchaeota archaeon]|jgi:DNA-directed RNA polymerase subunit RPC12/RpoP
MEINNTQENKDKAASSSENDDLIRVTANISCPSCSYKKKFKNQFPRKDIEMMVVSIKVFDYLTCSRCGDILKLDLDFNV